jgi:hypothetical protein
MHDDEDGKSTGATQNNQPSGLITDETQIIKNI